MTQAKVLTLIENAGLSMTSEEGLAFIERTRRQLDRLSVAFPDADDIRTSPDFQNQMRRRLDALEADIRVTASPN